MDTIQPDLELVLEERDMWKGLNMMKIKKIADLEKIIRDKNMEISVQRMNVKNMFEGIRKANNNIGIKDQEIMRLRKMLKNDSNTDGCIIIKDYRLKGNKEDMIRRIDIKIQKYILRKGKEDDIKKLKKVKKIIERRPEVGEMMGNGMKDYTKIFTKNRIVDLVVRNRRMKIDRDETKIYAKKKFKVLERMYEGITGAKDKSGCQIKSLFNEK